MSLTLASSGQSSALGVSHVKTATCRSIGGGARQGSGDPSANDRGPAMGPGCLTACAAERDFGANGGRVGCRPRQRRSVPGEGSPTADAPRTVGCAVGRSASRGDVAGRRARVLGALGRTVLRRRHADHRAAARRVGPAPRPTGDAFGRVPPACQARLAKGGSGHATPQERPVRAGGMEKTSQKCWHPASKAAKSAHAESD